MEKRALLVGIDKYDNFNKLDCCVNDATAMHELLSRNEDGSPNYACRLLTSQGKTAVTQNYLKQNWTELFADFEGDILLYFAGHGSPRDDGGYIVTQDGKQDNPGLPMNDLITLANNSKAQSVLLILDCCYSGNLGDLLVKGKDGTEYRQAVLREGLTILAASRATQRSAEIDEHGMFTKLLLGALNGGAADVRGGVSAAAIYAYVEQALGAWDQRPMYKSHADRLEPVRMCNASVSDKLLRELPDLFKTPDTTYPMDPSFEYTHRKANKAHVAIFDKFKILRNARLLSTEDNMDLYRVALESKEVQLTPIGQFYWQIVKQGRI